MTDLQRRFLNFLEDRFPWFLGTRALGWNVYRRSTGRQLGYVYQYDAAAPYSWRAYLHEDLPGSGALGSFRWRWVAAFAVWWYGRAAG